MENFINVIKKDPPVQIKKNDMLHKYNRLPYKYQSKIGYETLIQNVFLIELELIHLMGATIVDIGIEIKIKISRTNYLQKI